MTENPPFPINLPAMLEAIEVDAIEHALYAAKNNHAQAARLLMLKRTTFLEKMKKYGMLKPKAVVVS